MDALVAQAMARWPHTPACFGWLGLDARGRWRMRDRRAQQLGLAGDVLTHPALLAFIARNYRRDARGRWLFQNGPQRVYVNLETTPHIARDDGAGGFALHTGAALGRVEHVFLSASGALMLQDGDVLAQLDDRDLAAALECMAIDGAAVGEEALLAWLDKDVDAGALALRHGGRWLAVRRLAIDADIERRFGFVRAPQPE